ncbi:MAG: type IX secretion system membrane protein PorP/SprF [Bacteroidetes bacterium]|nr:MAG: type IX secretion system membrane protein PorP/SprF [Bacteroidota bacterium]
MRLKHIGLIGVLFSGWTLFGQDIHFTQTAQTPLLINPAAAGVYDGWERVMINHRNQWLGAGTQFMTTNIAADANFGKTRLNDKAHLGVGVNFYNDIGGDSKFGMQKGALTLSGILPAGNGHIFSAGIQGGFASRKADLSRVTWMSQWNGSGFDQTLYSGEANGASSFTYMDAAAGLFYTYDGGQNTFQRNNDFKFQIGFSGYNLNRPQLKYVTVDGDRLYRKWIGHVGVIADLTATNWSIDGNAVQVIQGPHMETILGLLFRYRFQDGTKITGNFQDSYFGFGMYYRHKDAIAPTIMLDWKGFRFGVSYDVTISALRNAYNGGSLEFTLAYTNLSHALFKGRR